MIILFLLCAQVFAGQRLEPSVLESDVGRDQLQSSVVSAQDFEFSGDDVLKQHAFSKRARTIDALCKHYKDFPEPNSLIQYKRGACDLLTRLEKRTYTNDKKLMTLLLYVKEALYGIPECAKPVCSPGSLAAKALHYTICDLIMTLLPSVQGTRRAHAFSAKDMDGAFFEDERGYTFFTSTARVIGNDAFRYLNRTRAGCGAALVLAYEELFTTREDGHVGEIRLPVLPKFVTWENFSDTQHFYKRFYVDRKKLLESQVVRREIKTILKLKIVQKFLQEYHLMRKVVRAVQ